MYKGRSPYTYLSFFLNTLFRNKTSTVINSIGIKIIGPSNAIRPTTIKTIKATNKSINNVIIICTSLL